ncbi:metal tolerance protein C1 [Cucumis melo var. makuwa]|uniref:Metal tolerance protein C1 n=1 Tax=Cucumis melo var. makuwa TaxID=1194695 RepID=A0A5A7VI67_CUCMM|nr:metal tolerance protein C1 [Cucumis melo var. makuwa]TYK18096.1 metal tolerance protein C1 [Cucumis melo var. makuwa]
MGYRFHRLNPMLQSFYSRISPPTRNEFHSIPSFQSLNLHPQITLLGIYDDPKSKICRRWHLGHSHRHDDDHRFGQEGENIFKLGLGADIGLAVGKAVTGYLSGSTAIIADAAHSVSDVVILAFLGYLFDLAFEAVVTAPTLNIDFYRVLAFKNYFLAQPDDGWMKRYKFVLSGVALWSFKAGKAPKDKEHPYGHGKFETLGALGISTMLLATAGGIAWHASEILLGLLSAAPEIVNQPFGLESLHNHSHSHGEHHGIDMDHPILALNMTIISICIKEGLYWITKRAGEKQGSGLMKANAWHHRADAISSVVALIGVGGSILGVKFLDPLAGLVVSGMILKAGLQTGHQSILELVDAAIPADQIDPFKQTILQVEGVKGCHRLRGRRAGSSLYLDVHIEVDPFLSVSAAHSIGENVRQKIHTSHPEVSEVFIHIDPSISHFPPKLSNKQASSTGTSNQSTNFLLTEKNIEATVSDIILSKFPENMVVERITPHLLQGKILLQIEVSMPPDLLIRNAMDVAKRAENEILKADSNIVHVSIQLRLGHQIPQLSH